jgi:hypothetical protein
VIPRRCGLCLLALHLRASLLNGLLAYPNGLCPLLALDVQGIKILLSRKGFCSLLRGMGRSFKNITANRTGAYRKGLTDSGAFDTTHRVVLTACSELYFPERFLAATRFLVLDSSIFLENVCCRACVAR